MRSLRRRKSSREGSFHTGPSESLANPPLQADGRVGRPAGSLSRPPLNARIVSRTTSMLFSRSTLAAVFLAAFASCGHKSNSPPGLHGLEGQGGKKVPPNARVVAEYLEQGCQEISLYLLYEASGSFLLLEEDVMGYETLSNWWRATDGIHFYYSAEGRVLESDQDKGTEFVLPSNPHASGTMRLFRWPAGTRPFHRPPADIAPWSSCGLVPVRCEQTPCTLPRARMALERIQHIPSR